MAVDEEDEDREELEVMLVGLGVSTLVLEMVEWPSLESSVLCCVE